MAAFSAGWIAGKLKIVCNWCECLPRRSERWTVRDRAIEDGVLRLRTALETELAAQTVPESPQAKQASEYDEMMADQIARMHAREEYQSLESKTFEDMTGVLLSETRMSVKAAELAASVLFRALERGLIRGASMDYNADFAALPKINPQPKRENVS